MAVQLCVRQLEAEPEALSLNEHVQYLHSPEQPEPVQPGKRSLEAIINRVVAKLRESPLPEQ